MIDRNKVKQIEKEKNRLKKKRNLKDEENVRKRKFRKR